MKEKVIYKGVKKNNDLGFSFLLFFGGFFLDFLAIKIAQVRYTSMKQETKRIRILDQITKYF